MSLLHSPSIVTSGLVLYLDAANKKSYSGTGTIWNDLSNNLYSATLTNGSTYSSNNNGSIVFDGIDDFIVGPSISTQFTGDMTAEVWVRLSALPSDWVRIVGTGINNGGNRTFGLWFGTTGIILWQRWGAANVSIQPTNTVTLGAWNHIVATSSGSSHTLYLNGVSIGTSIVAAPWSSSGQDISIGYGYLHTYLNGSIGNVKLYNRGLSSLEVLQNFNATRSRYGI